MALNDDVPTGVSHADFIVGVDGREVAVESYVRAGEPPRTLVADISGAESLELVVRTSRWECSHAVWLDPQVDDSPAPITKLFDCLGRAEVIIPHGLPRAERCIATVVSPGFECLLDDMLGSLYANSRCQDAMLLVFVLDGNEACERVLAKYRATAVRCQSRARLNPMSKALLYSLARVVDARHYLCLDADMLVLGDLRPVFAALDACPEGRILACREGNSHQSNHLGLSLRAIYGGGNVDVRQLEITPAEEAYSLVVNDGLFAGGRTALLALDGAIRAIPQASTWVDGHPKVSWRNQFIFNLALARLQCGVELDSSYNVQLHVQDVDVLQEGARMRAVWRGRQAQVLHFSGGAKRKYPEWQGRFASVSDPLCAGRDGDRYSAFLEALHVWVARRGVKELAWWSCGSSDGEEATLRDSCPLLLVTLHHLIRGNGCVRVLESGTGRGLSAACLASAVSHRPSGRVVTLDPHLHDGRAELWATLPEQFRNCIESRGLDSLQGMQAALDGGETYDAALLDSPNTAERVWAEFQLAAQLVRPGGLILIHHLFYADGALPDALKWIEAAGYSVIRLRSAEGGAAKDDRLGLAVIENRLRPHSLERCPTLDESGIVGITTPAPQPARLLSTGTTNTKLHLVDDANARCLRQRPWVAVAIPPAVLGVPTMLSQREKGLLYWLSRDYFAGRGRIVDAGCFLGGSTSALAAGLRDRPDAIPNRPIVSYDLFRIEQYTLETFGNQFPSREIGTSFRAAFDRNLAPFDSVEVREGDICALGWDGEPIEILFLDIVKTPEVNNVVLAQFFPCLIAGCSVILQQDYHWGESPWIHITMELLADYVEILDWMPNGTVAYLLTAPLPADLLSTRVSELSSQRQLDLMDRAVARWSDDERGMVELARVMLIAELQGRGAALDEFRAVRARNVGSGRVEYCANVLAGIMGW